MDIVKQLGELALGSRLKRLGDRISADVAKVYKEQNINFEPKWFTVAFALNENDNLTILELADLLGLTHPAIVQFVNQMEKAELVTTRRNSDDRRKRNVLLTDKGKETFAQMKPVLENIDNAVKETIKNSGFEIMRGIEALEQVLDDESIYSKVSLKMKEKYLEEIEIITYDSAFKGIFAELNYEWLEKYFFVEAQDVKILSNPEEYIIEPGGEIFFAKLNDKIVGTCAVLKVDSETFELAKMGVTKAAQGKQVGKKLALAAIGFAMSKEAKFVQLETSSKLEAAVNLYKQLGFKIAESGNESKYARSLFKMRLDL